MGAIGLVRVVSNKQLEDARVKRQTAELAASRSAPQYSGLAGHVERFWQAALTAKRPIELRMLRALRQRTGVYEPDELQLIREQGGSEIYMMLTSAKCRGAESWLREILVPETERPWGLSPTPSPDLPPPVTTAIIKHVTDMALQAGWEIDDARIDEHLLKLKALAAKRMKLIGEEIASRMENKIADQFAEGGWDQALSDAIYDLVTFPAAFIKGPFLRSRKMRKWEQQGNQWVPKITTGLRLEYERRSPFDIYPAPAMRNIQHGGLIDRYRFQRDELQSLIGVPGYSDEALKRIIEQYGDKGFNSSQTQDTQRALAELRYNEQYDPEGTIEALNYWGSASGHMLMDWGYKSGVDVGKIEPHKEYQVEVWKTGGEIFKATLNPDPLGEKPYAKASFDEIPGAFWGLGLVDLMVDCQRMCNASARALSNNAAIASGPQVEVYVDRLADGETVTKPYPWKVHQMTSDMTGNNQRAVQFYQPNMNVQELLTIYQHFERQADSVTGFPNYTYGDSRVGGAGRTSSGLAQLMGNVGKGVRRVVSVMDRGIIRPTVTRTYSYNMENDEDPSIKGDLQPVAKGTAALLVKDMEQMRRKELLQATLNPLDAQIIGVKGRSIMLRETLKAADFPADEIVPDGLDLELAAKSMPQPHELLGNTGPNASATPGMNGAGGTPEGAANQDLAGQQPNGTAVRQATQGFANGGVVRDIVVNVGRDTRRLRMRRGDDGVLEVEEAE